MNPKQERSAHPGSYVDPAGTLYEIDGKILRGIRPAFAEFYAKLLSQPFLQALLGSQVVETTIAHEGLGDYPLTLEHKRIKPVSFCYEWPAPMLKDAALHTLEICLDLTEHGLILQDAYPWNILFEGTTPVFVDFTSIIPENEHLLWVAYDQFCRFFLYPLVLAACGREKLARILLFDSINGISPFEFEQYLPKQALLRMPWLLWRFYLPRLLQLIIQKTQNDKLLVEASTKMQPNREARRAFLDSLRRTIQQLPLAKHKSRWSQYYTDLESFTRPATFNPKQTTVARLLKEYQPKTVTDIGCNQGGYAILAAQAGAKVVAFDSDSASIALLYQLVCERNLNILPLVIDLLNPSPASGWRNKQFAAAPQRLNAEMTFALAVVHHLAITQRQTFERIVPALADYADKWLLTEFVPLDDPRSVELMVTNQREMGWYSLENFITQLQTTFSQVETFASYPEGRTLILCTR